MSGRLNNYDFKDFIEIDDFRVYKHLMPQSGIYVFIANEPIKRLVGKSPILKIGQTSNLKRRMSAYFREQNPDNLKRIKSRQTAYRLSRYLNTTENYYLIFKPLPLSELKDFEKNLLEQYYEIHYESPPLNMGLS
jgi:hypothetical protein